MGVNVPRIHLELRLQKTRGGGAMRAWEIAKGILIAGVILTGLGWFVSVALLATATNAINTTVHQASEKNQKSAAQNQAQKLESWRLVRQRRLQTQTGRSLDQQCRDWNRVQAEYDLPSTREGVARHCGALEKYLNAGL